MIQRPPPITHAPNLAKLKFAESTPEVLPAAQMSLGSALIAGVMPLNEAAEFASSFIRLARAVRLRVLPPPGSDSTEDHARVMAIEAVIQGFAQLLESAPLYQVAYPEIQIFFEIPENMVARVLGIEHLSMSRPDRIRKILKHPEWVEDRLVAMGEALARHALANLDRMSQTSRRLSPSDLLALIGGKIMGQEPIKIAFHPEDRVQVTDLRRRSTPTSVANLPAEKPIPPPGPDHRARADSLELELASLRQRMERFERAHDAEDSTIAQLREQNRSLRARLHVVEQVLAQRQTSEGRSPEPVAYPATWSELSSFSDRYLAGRVTLTPKALRAARRSVFENIPFAYQVLLHMAQDYVPMLRGESGARERWDAFCAAMKLRAGPTGCAVENHRTRAAYRVQHLGEMLDLDQHIQGSSSRDPREGFRLYFTVVDAHDKPHVVVGSFPSHLDSTLS